MILLVPFVIAVVAQPIPLDGFRANFAAIKAEVDYEFVRSFVDPRTIIERRFWGDPNLSIVEIPESRIIGQWHCDGTAQYFLFESPPELAKKAISEPIEKIGGKMRVKYIPKIEALYDGINYVGHPIEDYSQGDPRYLGATADSRVGLIALGKGPMFWWLQTPFPQLVEKKFSSVIPSRKWVMRAGHPAEYEGYRIDYPKAWHQLEVSYDPSVGFLPRLVREVHASGGSAQVKEFYLIDARPCKAGGFIPTEWYESEFATDRLPGDYSDETILEPNAQVLIGHMKVKKIRDRDRPVALQYLRNVRGIGTIGGIVPVAKQSTLSIAETKSLVGRRISETGVNSLPNLDADEMKAFTEPSTGYSLRWAGVAVAIVTILAGSYYWTRRKTSCILLAVSSLSIGPGCGEVVGPQVVKISGSFSPDQVLYDLDQFNVPLNLIIRNDGNVALKIFKADGGCSCRKIDQSSFPKDLRPGGILPVSIQITQDRRTAFQNLQLKFDTDHGSQEVTVPLTVLPRNVLEPEAVSYTGLEEGQRMQFEVVHRLVYEKDSPKPTTAILAPSSLKLSKTGAIGGPVKSSPGFMYEDVTYKIELDEMSDGLQKAQLKIVDEGGRKLCESNILWKHLPYLGTVPERAILGSHPIRVFLRCPDEAVELTDVISCSQGLKAVVSSPRILTITSSDPGKAVLEGFVEVGTTARNRSPLRIPVVKYASSL